VIAHAHAPRLAHVAIATDELPRELAEPLALAAKLGARLLEGAAIAELAALPADWRARVAKLDEPTAALVRQLSTQTSAARRGIAVCLAAAARDLGDGPIAFAKPFVRLVIHLFARHSAALAAVHAKLSARADAFASVLAGEADRAVLHRDAKHALDFVLAIPASEPALRRSCLVPLVDAISRGPIAHRLANLVAGNDRALRAGFAALCRGLPAPAAEEAELVDVTVLPSRVRAIDLACDVLAQTQSPTGSWHGDYGGPLFLLPMYIGTCHIVGIQLERSTRDGMIDYLTAHQNPDGGWGLDVEGDSHVFTSVLNYVALRLLGLPASDERLANARAWFLPRGGALASASWGKFFLAVLGLYDYDGVAPVPPELWLLPESVPFHPHRLWCHARMVYLPMSYLYGARAVLGNGPLLDEIRGEIYDESYDQIDWSAARARVAADDLYHPHDAWLTAIHTVLGAYERAPIRALRERALAMLLDHVAFEDRATNYICIGPVNKLFDLLVWHHAKPGGAEVQAHIARMPDYLWRAPDGVKMQGYNSSELWDTTFAVQALHASGRASHATLANAARFIEGAQIIEQPAEGARYYRHDSVGAWPFSTRPHGWPITDCTAEGLKATLALDAHGLGEPITAERRADAVARILSWQNADGGWATYEKTRGPKWLERFNPSEVFGEIMIDRSYTECTSACMTALRGYLPGADAVLRTAIASSIARGAQYLLDVQRPDGSWEGAWGVCFTYGTWFAVNGLAASEDPRAKRAIARACEFLIAHQQADGGWGETVESCRARRYIHAETGQAVMTSWALLTLCRADRADSREVRRGVEFLLRRQEADGTWPAEHIAGVFNHTCAIHYDAYLRIFPLWALSAAG
jgi:squalene/oxidosqualene cyclase-like protein